MDMPDTDRLGDFAKKKVAESDARMKKINPKGRKLDKSGNPIVTMDAVKKAGFTNLRDYLNDKKGLKRRDGKAPERTKEYMAKNMTAPMQGSAVRANPMGDAARDEAVMNDETRKRVSAPFTKRELDGPSDAEVKRGSPDMELMPYRPVPKDAKLGDRGAKRGSPDMELMPYRPVPKDAKLGDRGAKRGSPDMELMPYRRPAEEGYTFKSGGKVRGAGIAKRGRGKGRMC